MHSRLGPGLFERPYRECLGRELRGRGLSIEVEKLLPIEYDGHIIDFGYRLDILVESAVVLEIKAVGQLLPLHEAQLLAYLRLSRKRVGLLINFNVINLRDGIQRLVCG